jgi:hypothetical protein
MMRKTRFAAALAGLLALAPVGAFAQSETEEAAAPGFNDTSVEYKYGPNYREPGIRGFVPKNIVTLTYVDGGKMWSNFVNMDVLFSYSNDPAAGQNQNGAQAVEFYGLYRGDLSLNMATRSQAFTVGPVLRDVSMQIGFDANTKNTEFAPAKKLLTFGPNFHFNVPGFLNIALHVAREWNNNGIVGRSVEFDTTFEAEMVWAIPLAFTGLPLRFQGFMNVVAPKGRDGFGANTKTEVLAEPRLTLDVGALAFDKPNKVDVSLGYQYWLNKFGNNHDTVPGSLASTVFVAARYHF